MMRRSMLAAAMATIPSMSAGYWNHTAGAKRVDVQHRKGLVQGCMPKGIWYGNTPQYLSNLWYIEFQTVTGERLDVAFDDIISLKGSL